MKYMEKTKGEKINSSTSRKSMDSFSKKYLNKKVKVVIDRPLGSRHPQFGRKYLLNYGYLPGTKGLDGEEIDVYILGVEQPLKEFEGEVIAILHRFNDNDDKLIVVPEGRKFSDKEIKNLVNFQEKYFHSEIVR